MKNTACIWVGDAYSAATGVIPELPPRISFGGFGYLPRPPKPPVIDMARLMATLPKVAMKPLLKLSAN